mmetsp:Transcript_10618/g.9186  ORF Transcript_10618/g.9186 Transcript_10618/m.9186 type:complete len:156 (-) Transcript_10618:731-1198(-)
MNIFSTFFAFGDLALPKALSHVGYGLGVICILLTGLVNYYSVSIPLKIADKKDKKEKITYHTLSEEVIGKWAGVAVDWSIFLSQIGNAIGTIIFANKYLSFIFCHPLNLEHCDSTLYNLLICFLLIFPMTFVDNVHFFFYPSIISNIIIFMGVIV